MGWFSYKCPNHGDFKLSLDKRENKAKCPACQSESSAIIRVGGTSIVERLDNGAMSRAVERLSGIEEIMNERADKHTKEVTGEEESE